VELTDRELRWLRAVEGRAADGDDLPAADLVLDGLTLGSLARRTPAWTGPYVRLLDGLIERIAARWPPGGHPDADPALGAEAAPGADAAVERLALETGLVTLVGISSSLGGQGRWPAPQGAEEPTAEVHRASMALLAPVDACPQVVDIDFPSVALRRAEWVDGSLHLRLAPLQSASHRWTQFRVVGAEPRQWYQTGIDGATTDVTAGAMIVRVPLVDGVLEFTPGSY
jgi:hypothetical protein